jgi:hypothetical protein
VKLSDAIEKGSKGREQAHEVLVDDTGACCAMGAALLGVGVPEERLVERSFYYPLPDGWDINAMKAVMNMNDFDGMTFTQIIEALRARGE